MAGGGSTIKYFSYIGKDGISGGLNVADNPILVPPQQMTVCENFFMGSSAARKKRPGLELYHTGEYEGTSDYPAYAEVPTSDTPIRGGIEYWRYVVDGPTSDLFLHQGTKVWSIDARNTVAVDRTGALSLSIDGVPDYQVFNDALYFTSTATADGYNKWTGTGSAVAATAPADGAGKYITEHFGRMWMAGNPDFPYRVYYSSSLDPEDWTNDGDSNGGSLDLTVTGDPEGITGLASFQQRLYVWTRKKLYQITGNSVDDFTVEPITQGIGCISNASIVQTENDVFFASDRGYHSLRQLQNGRLTESTFHSRDVQTIWTEMINGGLYHRVMSVYDERSNCIFITVPTSGQQLNDLILVYNTTFDLWFTFPSINARSLWPLLIGNRQRMCVGHESGRIGIMGSSSTDDYGTGYAARTRSGNIYPGDVVNQQKRFTSITILASTTKPSDFSVGWIIDGEKQGSKALNLAAGTDLIGIDFVLGASRLGVGQYVPYTATIEDIGYGIQIEVVCGGSSDVEYYGYVLGVEFLNATFT